jgi:hypothetical protein
MDIGAPLVAHGEAPLAGEPGERALDDPAVAPEALTTVDAHAGNPDSDVAAAQRLAAAEDVVALIGVQLGGTLAPPPVGLRDGRDGIEQFPMQPRSQAEAGRRTVAVARHARADQPESSE